MFIEKQESIREAFVKDSFSKAILHKAILPDGKSNWIRDLLKITFEKFNLFNHPETIHVVSDGGSENKGTVLEWISDIGNRKVAK